MIEDVEKAVAIMIANPELEDRELVSLVAPLIEGRTEDAWLLVEVVPIAFGSILVDRAGVIRSGTFMRLLDSGKCSREIPLRLLPYWQESVAYVRLQESIPIPATEFFAVASRSAEIKTLNEMLESGVSAVGAASSPVVFMRRLPESALPTGFSKSSWWRFWE